jgi:hypothetical protein
MPPHARQQPSRLQRTRGARGTWAPLAFMTSRWSRGPAVSSGRGPGVAPHRLVRGELDRRNVPAPSRVLPERARRARKRVVAGGHRVPVDRVRIDIDPDRRSIGHQRNVQRGIRTRDAGRLGAPRLYPPRLDWNAIRPSGRQDAVSTLGRCSTRELARDGAGRRRTSGARRGRTCNAPVTRCMSAPYPTLTDPFASPPTAGQTRGAMTRNDFDAGQTGSPRELSTIKRKPRSNAGRTRAKRP